MKMESTELLVKIIAWIDLVISSLCFALVLIFALLLVSIPEFLEKVVTEDLDDDQITNHHDIDKFIQLEAGHQALVIAGLLVFWLAYFGFSVLLLRWAKRHYLPGIKAWWTFRLVCALIFFPLDLYWMYPALETGNIVLFVVLNAYDLFSLWAVFYLMRYLVSIRGETRQIVEFQSF